MVKLRATDAGGDAALPDDFAGIVRRLQRCIGDMFGVTVLWKDVDRTFRASIPVDLVQHLAPVCMAVKHDLSLPGKCSEECLTERGREYWRSRRSPLVKKCHAGVIEVLIPVHLGDEYLGVCHVGPFREARADPPSGVPRGLLSGLPLFEEPALAPVVELVHQMFSLAAPLRDSARHIACLRDDLHPAVRRTLETIEKEGRIDLRVADLARQAHISASRLVHLLKEVTGKGFTELRADAAMRRARRLLADAHRRVGDVAGALGYLNPNQFGNAFRRYHGFTATRYRARLSSGDEA